MIYIGIIIVVAILLLVFSQTVRNYLIGTVASILARVIGHIPTRQSVVKWIIVLSLIAILALLEWLRMWSAIGNVAHASLAAMIIGVGLIIRRVFGFRWILTPLIAVATLSVVFGLCLPVLKQAVNQNSEGAQAALGGYVGGFTTQAIANSQHYKVASRRESQMENIWLIGPDAYKVEPIKDEAEKIVGIKPTGERLEEGTRVFLSGEHYYIESKGISIERCTNLETGKEILIPTLDLKPVPDPKPKSGPSNQAPPTTLTKNGAEEKAKKEYFLGKGKYRLDQIAKVSFNDGPWVDETDRFNIDHGEYKVSFSKEVVVEKIG